MSELPHDARALVVTASNRAAAGVYEDRSGKALAAGLTELGFAVEGPHVRPDDVDELEAVLRSAVDMGFDVVLTTGGTGLSPTDVTPEATRAVLEREAPGHRGGGPPLRRGDRGADVGAVAGPGGNRRTDADRQPARIDRRGPGRPDGARPVAPPHRQPTARRRSLSYVGRTIRSWPV